MRNWCFLLLLTKNQEEGMLLHKLSGQAIRTPTFRRFARIESQKHTYV